MKSIIKILGIPVLVFIQAFAGCNDGSVPLTITPPVVVYSANTRYVTVPVNSSRSIAGADNLLYSTHDSDYNYYVFLLGHIDLVPVAYREPVIYNGITNVIARYEKSNATQESISQSVTSAFQHCISNKTTTNFGVVAKASVGIGWLSSSVKTSYENEVINEESSTRSFEDTWGTAYTRITQYSDTLEMIIGNNNEPQGKYRYSLFYTTDVFFVVKTDRAKTQVVDSYTAFCARPESGAWGIDYEPDLGGNFGRTASGSLLQIPLVSLSSLPDLIDNLPPPVNNLPPLIVLNKVATPFAGTPAGLYTAKLGIVLNSETEGAVIYYTTNGTTPTTSSPVYVTPIPVSVDTTIKAIAVKLGMTDSDEFTAKYEFVALKTEFTQTIRPGVGLSGSDIGIGKSLYDPNYDQFTTDFDILRLKTEGYINLEIHYSANVLSKKPFSFGGSSWSSNLFDNLYYHFFLGHDNTQNLNGHVGYNYFILPKSWSLRSHASTVSLSNYDNLLTIRSHALGGSNGLNAYIGETTIRVIAKK